MRTSGLLKEIGTNSVSIRKLVRFWLEELVRELVRLTQSAYQWTGNPEVGVLVPRLTI